MRLVSLSLALILGGAGVAAQSVSPADAFYRAIRHDDEVQLAALIAVHGPNAADTRGETPLMLATAYGTTAAMRTLLAAKADVRAVSGAGITALHLAVTDLERTKLLVEAGADVNAVSQIGRTPLLVAAGVHGAADVVRLLLERGARVDVVDNAGASPLSAAALVDNHDAARLLMARGAVPKPVRDGNLLGMPLQGAATNGNAALVRTLLSLGADVNEKSADYGPAVKHGRTTFGRITALHLAVNSLDVDTVEAVLAAGAAVDAQDIRGMTPLMFAIATDRPDVAIVSRLLKAGAQPALRDAQGESAIDWARRFNNPGVLAALRTTAQGGAAPLAATARPMPAHASRQAVERALPLLREVSDGFVATGGCVACHAQPLTEMAVALASARGWVPPGSAPELTTLAANLNANAPVLMQLREAGGQPDGFVYLTLGMSAQGTPANRATDMMVRYLAAKQRATGAWVGIGGTRAPMQDGDVNRTALAIRALTAYATPARAGEYRTRVTRAADWLQRQKPVTTQDVAMQLLGLHWADAHAGRRRALVAELRTLQRADGGWAQTKHLASDAYATGQALFTLRTLGVPASEPAVQRGATFLVQTQQSDGTWHVANRAMKLQPYFDSGFPYEHDQWISHAGSAWATVGLVLSTPAVTADAERAPAAIARIELHILDTTTLTDRQFLIGTRDGPRATIAAELRVPGAPGDTTRLPAIVMMQGSGGFINKDDQWSRHFNNLGIATLLVDSFAGRGIVETVSDQSQLGGLTMMIDAFRALELLARHPRIDPARIAIFGGSKGAVAALYSGVSRFRRMHGPVNTQFAAHIVLYAPCNRSYIDDRGMVDRPIRLFHGTADVITPIASCRSYVERLQEAGEDVVLREYAGAHHGFDNPGSPARVLLEAASPAECTLVERPEGRIVNGDTGVALRPADACIRKLGLIVGHDAAAHRQAVEHVTAVVRDVFRLSSSR